MAKPRIFISSTFYDLKYIRNDIISFIDNMGYSPVKHEDGDIPYERSEPLEEYCYNEIKNIDILISIIGGRFGSESQQSHYSISQEELKTAQNNNKQVYIFIDNNVLTEYDFYSLNKDKAGIKYKHTDDVRIFKFIEEIKSLRSNNNIKSFESVSDITKYLKEQFAGLFQKYLEQQTRIKEHNLIKDLEETASTLNKLVNYLSEENKGQKEEINKILTINHPIVENLKELLGIGYNFYIEGFDDLNKLFIARGYKLSPKDEDFFFDAYFVWTKTKDTRKHKISLLDKIFDENKKLKYLNKTEWQDNYILSEYEDITNDNDKDDLPF